MVSTPPVRSPHLPGWCPSWHTAPATNDEGPVPWDRAFIIVQRTGGVWEEARSADGSRPRHCLNTVSGCVAGYAAIGRWIAPAVEYGRWVAREGGG